VCIFSPLSLIRRVAVSQDISRIEARARPCVLLEALCKRQHPCHRTRVSAAVSMDNAKHADSGRNVDVWIWMCGCLYVVVCMVACVVKLFCFLICTRTHTYTHIYIYMHRCVRLWQQSAF
jgi:hypothetical protein